MRVKFLFRVPGLFVSALLLCLPATFEPLFIPQPLLINGEETGASQKVSYYNKSRRLTSSSSASSASPPATLLPRPTDRSTPASLRIRERILRCAELSSWYLLSIDCELRRPSTSTAPAVTTAAAAARSRITSSLQSWRRCFSSLSSCCSSDLGRLCDRARSGGDCERVRTTAWFDRDPSIYHDHHTFHHYSEQTTNERTYRQRTTLLHWNRHPDSSRIITIIVSLLRRSSPQPAAISSNYEPL